ncbi:MAG: hypothetical protein ACAH59_00065, partial [Pseudobdellovibrionaceae bacterium]
GKLWTREGEVFELMDLTDIRSVNLITDVYGVLSYAKDLHQALQKTFQLMAVEGVLFLKTESNRTQFQKKDPQSVIDFEKFLRSIPGLEVEGQFGILKIRKKAEKVEVPLFRLRRYDPQGFPAYRSYELISSSSFLEN